MARVCGNIDVPRGSQPAGLEGLWRAGDWGPRLGPGLVCGIEGGCLQRQGDCCGRAEMAATANAPPSPEPPSPSPPSPPEAGGRRLLWLGARREPCCGHEAEGERARCADQRLEGGWDCRRWWRVTAPPPLYDRRSLSLAAAKSKTRRPPAASSTSSPSPALPSPHGRHLLAVTGTAVASWPSPSRRYLHCRRLMAVNLLAVTRHLLAFNLLTVTCSPALPSLFAVNLLAVTGTAVTSSPSTSSPSHALPSLFAVASSPSTSSPSPALPSPRRHRHCRRLMAVTSSPSPVLPSPPRRQPPHRHLHCRHLAVTGTAVASCPSPPRRHQHCRRLLAVNLLAVASLPLPQPQRSKADWRPEARARGQQHRPPRPQIRLRTPLICEPQRQQEQEPSFAVLAGPSALEAPRDALRYARHTQ
ncbi:hypothetical protein PLESTF_000985500 [Pleodorina starrii]|nr:hypothetical protein PLESTF_000985500 [Pleodorina starrii]